jgi:hypothetical protein
VGFSGQGLILSPAADFWALLGGLEKRRFGILKNVARVVDGTGIYRHTKKRKKKLF